MRRGITVLEHVAHNATREVPSQENAVRSCPWPGNPETWQKWKEPPYNAGRRTIECATSLEE